MRQIATTQETKIVTIAGTKINPDGPTTLHAVQCECGNRIVRAAKESSLNYYKDNPKYTAKCCGSQLHYIGEVEFIGDTLTATETSIAPVAKVEGTPAVTEVTVVEVPKNEAPVTETKVETPAPTLTDMNTLISVGRKGITNAQMIPAIVANIDNDANLQTLFDNYEKVFMASAKYVKDSSKAKLEKIIQTKYPEFTVPMGKKMREKSN